MKTIGCQDVGFDCGYRITADDNDEQIIVDATVAHAKAHHPELGDDSGGSLSKTVREHIRSLELQSHTEVMPKTETA